MNLLQSKLGKTANMSLQYDTMIGDLHAATGLAVLAVKGTRGQIVISRRQRNGRFTATSGSSSHYLRERGSVHSTRMLAFIANEV